MNPLRSGCLLLWWLCLCTTTTTTLTLADDTFMTATLEVGVDDNTNNSSSSSSSSSCDATTKTFLCPNCGGMEVTDCLDCHGYLNTDKENDICFARHLFSSESYDTTDPDHYYHYLWNDLVGLVVWFLTAGIAMACGVGGGGIYVPLGILLFQFAPKPASGLSQASIFGASLGGILLNSVHHHPQTRIRSDPGVAEVVVEGKDKNNNSTEEKELTTIRRHVQKQLTSAQEQAYAEQQGGEFFTRPLIHYDMALFLAPMEMAGAVLGVLIQKVLPNWLYLLIAGLVLGVTAYKTYGKFFAARQNEKQQQQQDQQQQEQEEAQDVNGETEQGQQKVYIVASSLYTGELPSVEVSNKVLTGLDDGGTSLEASTDSETPEQQQKKQQSQDEEGNHKSQDASLPPPSAISVLDNSNHHEGAGDNAKTTDRHREQRIDFLRHDMRQYPREKILALIILWMGLFLLTLMKGGKGVESIVGLQCNSPIYSLLIVAQFLWMFGFALVFGRKLYQDQVARVAVQYPYLPKDPVWDTSSLKFYGGFTFVAGIVAGLIGIGGGMVLGPLMIIMGIHPRVSSATTATMIVLTSSSVAVIFVTSGMVPWDYALCYFCVCFCGAIVGKKVIDDYVKRTGRASMLVLILATIIALATVGCLVIMFTGLAADGWCLDGFHEFCSIKEDGECPVNRLLQQVVTLQ